MKRTFVPGLLIGLALALVAGSVAFALGWLAPTSLAQTRTPTAQTSTAGPVAANAPGGTIIVVGEGTIKIRPDVAHSTIGVETMGSSVKEATAEAARTMEAVMAALKAQGIAEADMQTTGYSVWVERDRGMDGRLSERAMYRVNNMVNVTIRRLDQVGNVLDAAMEAGANQVHGVNFSIADPTRLESQAREKAVANALAKATELAALNRLEVGSVVSVSEVIGAGGGMYDSSLRAAAAQMGMGGGAGPISPGEMEVTMRLQVVYGTR
jgi:hypothetical protein